MSPPNVKTPPGKGDVSGKAGEAGEEGNLEAKNRTRIGILAEHFCVCCHGVPCILCLEWNRTAGRGEARWADSFRHQALSSVIRAGG